MGNDIISRDVIILGAGINGCGVAHELARNGFSVTVLEKSTIGSGTSSKSSRLIHGGLRYLEQFEFGLVHESLQDRQELLRKYPQTVKLKPFYIPVYASSPRPAWMIWCGLKLYDFLAGKHVKDRSSIVNRKLFKDISPSMTQKGLKAVFRYYDGKTNDLDLTRKVAREAVSSGAEIHQFVQILSITQKPGVFTINTNRGEFSTPTLINATGPWIDEVNVAFDLPARFHIRKISGIHLVIKELLVQDLMFMQTKEKRIFFIIPEPENNQTIIGTTEREESGPVDSVQVNPDDVDYLLQQLNEYMDEQYQVSPDDVKSSTIGVRPLIAHKDTPTDLSREYALDLHRIDGATLLHIFGGKLTTYLSLAREVRKQLGVKI